MVTRVKAVEAWLVRVLPSARAIRYKSSLRCGLSTTIPNTFAAEPIGTAAHNTINTNVIHSFRFATLSQGKSSLITFHPYLSKVASLF
jgi:hypothetical protein